MDEGGQLFGPEFDADPYAEYARLRAGPPCRAWVRDGLYGTLVSRYDDVRSVLADQRLSKDPRFAPEDWQAAGRGRPLEDRSGLGTHLLTTDPPEHTRLRRVVSAAFTTRRVEELRGRVQQIADSLIDGLGASGEAELISEFAFPLPVMVICELLGVPAGDQLGFRQWVSDVVSSRPGTEDARPAALEQLGDYVRRLISAKRRSPGDDLVSALVRASDQDGRLTEPELLAMVFLLLIAGYETTVSMIGNGMLALLCHPDQLALLRARPDLLDSAIEEILRYDSSVWMATWRFATEPVEIGGRAIPAGEPVLAVLAAANRDPDQFTAPDRLDITARRTPHLGFGRGIHHCIGAPLARLEGQVAVETLLRRLPGMTLAVPPDRLRWRHSLTIRGLHELPVILGSAAG